uniref:Uncharacterized protein n=1 Tax=Anguilla anguilla TaxID=7936 RepID=A0A0E9PID0_ANGAN
MSIGIFILRWHLFILTKLNLFANANAKKKTKKTWNT